ncbi:MAG: Fructose-bisphosphate aldolase [Candidatus Amesbacteria bacterium GW2011_GWB1_47_19]|nr:MAG: Fructose-bisphosphate aldolase [Candidatus Amesbacteria bacterium GW2011_GWB1_47_19]
MRERRCRLLNKCLLLAYDQGMEHGPTDFSDENVDPAAIEKIAKDAGVFTGIVFQAGIAEKYRSDQLPPLVVKLNGKTGFHKKEEPVSLQLCSVERAMELGATAVGYTIYVGSEHEEEMMKEFGKIVEEAHEKDLPVVAWMYPRGKHIEEIEKRDRDRGDKKEMNETIAYAARLGLELGADMVKLPFTGDTQSFSWVVKSAGKTRVVVQGGGKKEEGEFLEEVRQIMDSGAAGMAVGRNVWQHPDPVGIAKKVAQIIWG